MSARAQRARDCQADRRRIPEIMLRSSAADEDVAGAREPGANRHITQAGRPGDVIDVARPIETAGVSMVRLLSPL
jgi:CheY-like chemotaxis protein